MAASDCPPEDVLVLPDADAWRAWLLAHHGSDPEAWLAIPHRGSGRPGPDYEAAVEQALCVGWVDGIRRTHDDGASKLRFTARRPRSPWSESNLARVERLEAAGLMTEAGRAAFERR